MKIWLINHYALPPQYYPLARPSLFAKNLINMGHDVTIIAASTVHNSDSQNLIPDKMRVMHIKDKGIPYVLINCTPYKGNGIKRIKNIWEFARRLPHVLDSLEKPDIIVATLFDPFTCLEGIKYAKKHNIKAVAEIADLWPETLVAYKGVSPNNPIVKYLRNIEKRIYILADAIVFTMEGAYDYIEEQGWSKEIPKSKVHYINNGIDLEQFDYDKTHYCVDDEDLNKSDLFKVIYAGSIRKVNNLGRLLDIAKYISNPKIRFLIWGDGDELSALKERREREQINNVVFKGKVDKQYIPYITSHADLNIAHNDASVLFRFGISFNKIFDYLAAGKPILCDFPCKYNPVLMGGAGVTVDLTNPEEIAKQICDFIVMDHTKYQNYCDAARKTAEEYDFKRLTNKLVNIIDSIK